MVEVEEKYDRTMPKQKLKNVHCNNVYIFLKAWVQAELLCDFEWADVKQAKRFMKKTKCRVLLMRHKMDFKMWKMEGTYCYQCISPRLLQKPGSDFL